MKALDYQVDGDHYIQLGDYQPWKVLQAWLTPDEFRGYMKGQAIAYLVRERSKGGADDVAKAQHYLHGLLDLQPEAHASAAGNKLAEDVMKLERRCDILATALRIIAGIDLHIECKSASELAIMALTDAKVLSK